VNDVSDREGRHLSPTRHFSEPSEPEVPGHKSQGHKSPGQVDAPVVPATPHHPRAQMTAQITRGRSRDSRPRTQPILKRAPAGGSAGGTGRKLRPATNRRSSLRGAEWRLPSPNLTIPEGTPPLRSPGETERRLRPRPPNRAPSQCGARPGS
jgi:hypothetical protein